MFCSQVAATMGMGINSLLLLLLSHQESILASDMKHAALKINLGLSHSKQI